MNIIFSDHARLKLDQRKLSERMVCIAIKRPDRSEYIRDGREAFYKKFRKRSLKVVIVRKYERIIVITARWVA